MVLTLTAQPPSNSTWLVRSTSYKEQGGRLRTINTCRQHCPNFWFLCFFHQAGCGHCDQRENCRSGFEWHSLMHYFCVSMSAVKIIWSVYVRLNNSRHEDSQYNQSTRWCEPGGQVSALYKFASTSLILGRHTTALFFRFFIILRSPSSSSFLVQSVLSKPYIAWMTSTYRT